MASNEVLVLSEKGAPLAFERRAAPQLGADEALVRVEACGVCGSDLFLQDGGFGTDKFPIVPGHEASGTVEAVGSAQHSPLVGEQVAMYYIDAPRDSHWAKSGRINIGPDVTRMGVDVDGAFAKYISRPVSSLLPIEPRIDPVLAALATDAFSTPLHALTAIAEIKEGDQLLVIGPGGIGSNAVQLGALLGADVAVVGRSEKKLHQARKLGASLAVDSTYTPTEIKQLIGRNIDIVLECSGAPTMAQYAIECAGYGGTVVLVGASNANISFQPYDLIQRELSLKGSRGFTTENVRQILDYLKNGLLHTDHLTSDIRSWREANSAFADLRSGDSMRAILLID